ncbi:MAG TPA: hypothetical protein VGF74_15185 [Thermoleophilaceae bacterium]
MGGRHAGGVCRRDRAAGDTTPAYEAVPHDGAARAAELIAELVGRR